jgi:hypothetical protein
MALFYWQLYFKVFIYSYLNPKNKNNVYLF